MRRLRVLVSAACVAGLLIASGGTPAHAWPSDADTVTCTTTPTVGYYPSIGGHAAGSFEVDGNLTCAAAESGVVGMTNPYIPPGPSRFMMYVNWAPVTVKTGTFNGNIIVVDGGEAYNLFFIGAMVGGAGTFVITGAVDGDGYALVGFGGGSGTLAEGCAPSADCLPNLNNLALTATMA